LSLSPVVPGGVRHDRNKTLRNLSFMKMQAFTHAHEGQVRPVLFERGAGDRAAAGAHVPTSPVMMEGYTDNYIKVTTPYRSEWANQIVDWRL
jgi:threonylcarbamoyladenosine tRNA methylthiotransferase MtaB